MFTPVPTRDMEGKTSPTSCVQDDRPAMFGNTAGSAVSAFGQPFEDHERRDFRKWKVAQSRQLRERGASEDLDRERAFIEGMIKNVLRGYVCHREVDEYSQCLIDKKIVDEDELHRADVNMKRAEKYCKKEVYRYQECMGKKLNHETIIEAATGHAGCEDLKASLQVCLERVEDPTAQEKSCMRDYYALLRCGLNSMFDDYWKRVCGIGSAEEVHLFQTETDRQKQMAVQKMKERYGN